MSGKRRKKEVGRQYNDKARKAYQTGFSRHILVLLRGTEGFSRRRGVRLVRRVPVGIGNSTMGLFLHRGAFVSREKFRYQGVQGRVVE